MRYFFIHFCKVFRNEHFILNMFQQMMRWLWWYYRYITRSYIHVQVFKLQILKICSSDRIGIYIYRVVREYILISFCPSFSIGTFDFWDNLKLCRLLERAFIITIFSKEAIKRTASEILKEVNCVTSRTQVKSHETCVHQLGSLRGLSAFSLLIYF